MITRLRLQNFQAWQSLDLTLSPITIVIGETNAGKSSILRGLACALFNAMEGTGMVRTGEKVAEVELETDDGHRVLWARGAGVNRYTCDGQLYDKPGRAVPAAVQAALQIQELEFDGETVRLQWAPQMDAPFLLADSGAKATRMLSVAGNAAVVSQAARLAVQHHKSEQDAARAATAQRDSLAQQVEGFSDVLVAEPVVRVLTRAIAAYDALVERKALLEKLSAEATRGRDARDVLQARVSVLQKLVEARSRLVNIRETKSVLQDGLQSQSKLTVTQTRVTAARGLAALAASLIRLHEIRTLCQDTAVAVQQREAARRRVHDVDALVTQRRTTYQDLVKSLTCPVCQRVADAA